MDGVIRRAANAEAAALVARARSERPTPTERHSRRFLAPKAASKSASRLGRGARCAAGEHGFQRGEIHGLDEMVIETGGS